MTILHAGIQYRRKAVFISLAGDNSRLARDRAVALSAVVLTRVRRLQEP